MKQKQGSPPPQRPVSPPVSEKLAQSPRRPPPTNLSDSSALPNAQERASGASLRRPSNPQLRSSKSNGPSISPMDQVKQHRQPLIDKLQKLSKAAAPIAAAVARIKEALVRLEDSKDKPIVMLREELSQIGDPIDLFDDEAINWFCTNTQLHPQPLRELKRFIVNLTNMKEELETLYPTLAGEVQTIISEYEGFQTRLLNSSIDERSALFNPSATVVGECIDFGSLDQETALKLHCCDRYKNKVKGNEHGMHAVAEYDGVFYKPNVSANDALDIADFFIQPGMEFAIYALLQLFAGEHCVAAASSWIKVSRVQKFTSKDKPDGFMEKVIQTGLGISGISLQHLLILISRMQKLTRQVYRNDAIQAIRALLDRENKYQELLVNFPILRQYLSEEANFPGRKKNTKPNIEQLMGLDIVKKITVTTQAILDNLTVDQKRYFLSKDPRGFGTLLNNSSNEQDVFNRLNFVANLLSSHSFADIFSGLAILPDCMETVTQFYIDGLIGLFPYVKYFKVLFPNGTPEELLDALPNFLSRLDMAHFSATFIGHLVARPSDAKPDNFQVRLIRDPITQAVVSFQVVGIDNDRALAYPIIVDTKDPAGKDCYQIGIKCVFYLFKTALQQPISWVMRERILSQLPINWTLHWAALLYEHSQVTQQRIDQKVLLDTDRVEMTGGKDQLELKTVLDLPLKLTTLTLRQLYLDIVEIYKVLEENSRATHQDLLKKLQPILAAYYNKAINDNPDIYFAYEKVHDKKRQQSLDETFTEFDYSQFKKEHDSYVTERVLSVDDAIVQFIDQFDWGILSSSEQTQVLDFCACHFPKLKLFTKCPVGWLNKKLIESVYQGKSALVKLLIRARADVALYDDAGRTLLHILISRMDRLPQESILSTLTILLQNPQLKINRFDNVGLSPLMTLVNYYSKDKLVLVTNIIEALKNRGVKFDQTDPVEGKTPLDRAIERDLPDLFILLIRCGAGRRMHVERANDYLTRYSKTQEYRGLMQEAHDILMQNNSEYAYRFTLSAMCSHEPQKESMLIEGAECGFVYLLPECISQVFNEAGEFHEKHSDQMGRRKVAPVYTAKEGKRLQMHLKENPELPGNELAVGSFRRRLFGRGAPFTEVFKFVNPKGLAYPVIFSKSIKGRNFHAVLKDPQQRAEVLVNLDRRSVSEMIVSSILINPEDEKPDNVIVDAIPTPEGKKYCLPCVDNDHGFVSPLKKDATNRTELQVKTIYFCLDNMNEQLHPDVIAEIIELDPEQLLREWLTDLAAQEDRYQQLFTSDEKKRLLTKGSARGLVRDIKEAEFKGVVQKLHGHLKNPQTPSVVPIPIRPELVIDLYKKILAIQRAFKKNPYITGMQLLVEIIPEIGVFYQESFKKFNTPLERFDSVTETLYSKAIAGRYGTMANSHQILRSLNIPEEFVTSKELQSQFGPKQALSVLKLIHSQSKELDEIVAELYEGNFKRFRNLKFPKHKETVVNKIDWKLVKAKEKTIEDLSENILQVICKESYTRLKLAHCPNLNSAHLTKFLKNSPGLIRLDLSYCPVVNTATIQVIEKHALNLEVLNLQGTLITEFTTTNLLKLRRLMLQDCVNLTGVKVSGARSTSHRSLSMLAIDRSSKVNKLDVNSDVLMIFSCEAINPDCAEYTYEEYKDKNSIIAEAVLKYTPKKQLDKLQQLFLAGKFDAAASYADAIIKTRSALPKSILQTAYKISGISYYNLKQFEKACMVFDENMKVGIGMADLESMLFYGMSVREYGKNLDFALDLLSQTLELEQPKYHIDKADILKGKIQKYNKEIKFLGKIYLEMGLCRFTLRESCRFISEDFACSIRCDSNLTEQIISFIEKISTSDLEKAIDLLGCILNHVDNASKLYYFRGVLIISRVDNTSGLSKYELAIKDLDQSIRIDPNHADSYYQRGLCKKKLVMSYRSEDALEDFNAALRIDPNHKGVLALIGNSIQTIAKLDGLISRNPSDSESFFLRGVAKAKMGRHREAVEDFNFAYKQGYSSGEFYFRRGKSKLKLIHCKPGVLPSYEALKEVKDDFNLAIQDQYHDPSVYFHLGIAWYLADIDLIDKERYRKYFLEAISKNHKYAHKFPIQHIFHGEEDKAVLLEFIEISNALEVISEKSLIRTKALEKKSSFDSLGLTIQDEASRLLNTAINLMWKGSYHEAIMLFEKAIQQNKKMTAAYYHRGKCYTEIGSYSQALIDLNEAISIVSSQGEGNNSKHNINQCGINIYDIFIARGRAYLMIGEIDKASGDFNYAIEHDVKNIDGYLNSAILNIYNGCFTLALQNLTLASQHECDRVDDYLILSYKAFIFLAMKNFQLDFTMSTIYFSSKDLKTDDPKSNSKYLRASYIITTIEALRKFSKNDFELGDQLFANLDKSIPQERINLKFEMLVLRGLGIGYVQELDKIQPPVDHDKYRYLVKALEALQRAITISPGFDNVIGSFIRKLIIISESNLKNKDYVISDIVKHKSDASLLIDFSVFGNKINSHIMGYLPMRDCVSLSASSFAMWNKSKGILLLRALNDVDERKSNDNLTYLADILDSSPIFRKCNPNHLCLARVLAKAEHHLDSLVKRSQYGDWVLLGMCGLELRKITSLLSDIQNKPEFSAVQIAIIIGSILGGHLDIIKVLIDRVGALNLELLKQLLEFSLLGGNFPIFQFLRAKYHHSFVQLLSSKNLDSVIEKFFEFSLRGGDEETVEAMIAEYSNMYDVSRLNSLALFIGQWKFYKRYETHGAFDAVVIVDRDDLSQGDNYERRVMIASSATFTGNLNMLISLADDVKHVHPKLAIECGSADIFWYFVDNQFLSLTDTFDNGDTVLHILARCGHLSLLREVINKNNFVMVYFVNDKNQTLLHAAAEAGHRNVYDYLMKHFYQNKPTPVDTEGNTPEDLARNVGNVWFVKALEQNRVIQAVEQAAPKQEDGDADDYKANESNLIY